MYAPRQMTGRYLDGAERDHGRIYHAVETGKGALCGATPGQHWGGWSSHSGVAVDCPRCLKKLTPPVSSALPSE